MKSYKVVPIQKRIEVVEGFFNMETRFIIIDEDGVIVDDAQGYGYKTASKAHKAAWYKFNGGKKKIEEQRVRK